MAAEDLNQFSWYVQNATRQDAQSFLDGCEHGRFIVRPSSMAGCLALSHKLPTLDIGHALIQSTPGGWTITGSDKSFPTVEGLLRSRTLTFPQPGEFGAPGQMTHAHPSQGRVASAAALASPPPAASPSGVASTGGGNGDAAAAAAAPASFENNEALDKVLTCLVNPNNTTLELFSMNLTSLPSEVNDLQQLQSLYLSNNSFDHVPREALSLRALRTLWFQANNLTSLPPEIAQLQQLEKLKLSSNMIDARSGFPAEMASMSKLQEIWLENNKLTELPPALLGVASLRRIWIDHNQIRAIPRDIGRLVQLERLSMTKNLVQEVPEQIGLLRNLEKLWLNDNELHSVSPAILQCQKLQMLALANNRITNPPDFAALPHLTDLRLENNPCFNEAQHGGAGGASPALGAGGPAGEHSPSLAARGGNGSPQPADGTMRRNGSGQVPGGGATSQRSAPTKSKSVFGKLGFGRKDDVPPLQALHAAIEANDERKVRSVMKSRRKTAFDLAGVDIDGLTPLNKAVKLGLEGVVKEIVTSANLGRDDINIKDKFGYTPLHWAVRGSSDSILLRLLECPSINVDVDNRDSNSPLHYFAERNHSPDCERIGQMLIDKGAVVNKVNNNGETPLHKAIFNNQVRLMMVRLLINNGADVNVLTLQRQSPLQYAVRLRREDLVAMLLKAGARLDLRSSDGLTAYEAAVKEKCDKIAQLLAECEKLQQWLTELELERLFPVFVREELYFDTLPDLSEAHLDKLGIKTTGQRMKLMRAVQKLRNERTLQTMAQKEKQAELEQPPDFASNAAGAEGEWLQELTAGMDLREGEHIQFGDIELLEELGSGAAGKVYKGLYQGRHVAVKVLKELKDGGELEDFKKELEIMTSIRDPHMVFFFGVCLKPQLCMVMELASRKSLFHVLNRDGLNIGWPQALEWGAQAAAGTACLHEHDIVHRDLKSLNLLMTQDWVVKVADFGLARFNNEGNLETLNKMRGTMAYCVPECHEILTSRGFMDLDTYRAHQHDDGLLVASFDAARGAMIFERPQALREFGRKTRTLVELTHDADKRDVWAPRAGAAVARRRRARLGDGDAARGVSLLVTPDHDLYVARDAETDAADADGHEFGKVKAGAVLRAAEQQPHATVRQLAHAPNGVLAPPAALPFAAALALDSRRRVESFCELYGYWLGAGALERAADGAVCAVTMRADDAARVVALLDALGVAYAQRSDGALAVCDDAWLALFGGEYGHAFAARGSAPLPIKLADALDDQEAMDVDADADTHASASLTAPIVAPSVASAPASSVRSGVCFDAVSSASGSFMAPESGVAAKWCASWLWTLDAAALRCVLAGLERADGEPGVLFTASARFRDELVRVCLMAGYSAHFERVAVRDSAADAWAIEYVAAARDAEACAPTLRAARGEIAEREHTGRVWCFTMPSGFIWTRRVAKDKRGAVTHASRPLLTGNCPPEAYFAQAFDYKSDVYSLAIIVWELVNRCLKSKYEAPFSEYKNLTMDFQIIIQVAKSHLRPTIPERCPTEIREVIENAWVFERDDRPDARGVQKQLRDMISVYEASAAAWDATIQEE